MLTDRFVTIEGTTIAAITARQPPGLAITRLAGDSVLSPGFVDLQVNGGGGVLFNDKIDADGLARIAHAHRHAGTTSILPTLISGSREQLRAAMAVVDRLVLLERGRVVLEGPAAQVGDDPRIAQAYLGAAAVCT